MDRLLPVRLKDFNRAIVVAVLLVIAVLTQVAHPPEELPDVLATPIAKPKPRVVVEEPAARRRYPYVAPNGEWRVDFFGPSEPGLRCGNAPGLFKRRDQHGFSIWVSELRAKDATSHFEGHLKLSQVRDFGVEWEYHHEWIELSSCRALRETYSYETEVGRPWEEPTVEQCLWEVVTVVHQGRVYSLNAHLTGGELEDQEARAKEFWSTFQLAPEGRKFRLPDPGPSLSERLRRAYQQITLVAKSPKVEEGGM